jgi:hypothetical protein
MATRRHPAHPAFALTTARMLMSLVGTPARMTRRLPLFLDPKEVYKNFIWLGRPQPRGRFIIW